MKKNSVITFMKIILLIVVVMIVVLLFIYLTPIMKHIATPEGTLLLKAKIQQLGFWGFWLLLGLQVAQVFLVILPGEPIEILAGMCYGGLGGTIFILVSVFAISTVIVSMVKKFGRKFVDEFWEKKKIDKIENSKLFKNPKTVQKLMAILFLLPGTPKDLLLYIGGLLPIPKWRFIVIATFFRLPSVVSSTVAGEKIIMGDWKIGVLIYILTVAITGIVILIINYFDNNKTTKEAIDTLK